MGYMKSILLSTYYGLYLALSISDTKMNKKCIFHFICLESSNRPTNISIRCNKCNVGGKHRENNVEWGRKSTFIYCNTYKN